MSGKLMVVSTDTMRKMARFIELAGPIVKQAEVREKQLSTAIPQMIDGLVSNGHLSPHMKEAKAKQFIENPGTMAEALQKLASAANTRLPAGQPAGEAKEAKMSANDVFVERLLGGTGSAS